MKKILVLIVFTFAISRILYSQNWSITYSGQQNNLRGVYFINDNSGYIVGDNIFLKTTNSGNNWTATTSRYKLTGVYFIDNLTGIAVGKSNDSGFVLKTTNNGGTWSNYYLGQTSSSFVYGHIFFKDNNTGYVVYPNTNGGYYRTTNGGLYWIFNTFTGQNILDVKWIGNIFYKIGSISVSLYYKPAYWTSTDETNWSGPTYCAECDNNEFGVSYFTYDTVRYFITDNSSWRILRSSVTNPTWYEIGSASQLSYYFNNGVYIHYGYMNNPKSILKSSSNSGYTWVTDTLSDFSVRNLFFTNQNTGFAISDNGLIAKTTNGGGIIGIETISTETPKQFSLAQNYPNPFNPMTNIKFDVSKTGNVKILIFDVLGHQVATLVNQILQTGSYKIEWNADNYPSGIYFYKLETNDFVTTKKMTLIK